MARILLIDDDELVREALAIVLEETGHQVTQAHDGNAGMKEFLKSPFDLVVTDLIMPEKEGLSVLMDIRKIAPKQKVIVISGGGRTQNTELYLNMARDFGTDEMLAKPFNATTFRTTVERVLSA